MNSFYYFAVFVFGLIVGSFLNCVIYRLEIGRVRQLADLRGRSFCPGCKHKLGFWDLVPVFSFLFLKGRCRYCQKPISWQYPLVELATGLLFVLATLEITTMVAIQSFYYFVLICFLIVIFVYDLKHYLIPDFVVYSAIALTFVYLICWRWDLEHIWAALGLAGFFLAIVLVSREKWMGLGDVKLGFLIGLILGWPGTLLAVFLATSLGAIIGIGLIVAGKKKMKSEVPFGPFLVMGTLVALFWGEKIINWYVQIFYFN